MDIIKFKPTTSSLRHRTIINKKNLFKYRSVKKLTLGFSNKAGRNNYGRITCCHLGGGLKKKYRIIDFRHLLNLVGFVKRIEYDPNRSSFIALVCYFTGILSYNISPKNLKIGDSILSGNCDNFRLRIGYSLPLIKIPLGSFLYNIELKNLKGGQFLRAAGAFCVLMKKYNSFAYIRLRSGEYRYIPINCFASLGRVSNENFKFIRYGKAGVNRWLNRRPSVRGVATNPVDHPHGGRTKGFGPSYHFNGQLIKGMLTRNKRYNNKLIVKKFKN